MFAATMTLIWPAISSCIELLYSEEKRVDVLPNYSKFIHYQWNNNLFVFIFHHGDRNEARADSTGGN